jgi:hypothetical protein
MYDTVYTECNANVPEFSSITLARYTVE